MVEPGDWNLRLGFIRDVLDGAMLAAEDGRVYSDAALVRRAIAYLEQHIQELKSST